MKLTGAQAVCECLVREGIETVFGIPGGGVIHLYHALPEYPIHHVLMRHEQAAIHAADGYARATGKVGVCIATSGPGATNLLTGLATALRDSSPVVAVTGQAPSPVLGTEAFQEVDITGITLPATKHNYLVTDVLKLPRVVREAFYIAYTGRPGPVLVTVAADVQAAAIDYVYPDDVDLPGYRSAERQSHGSPLLEETSSTLNQERWVEPDQRAVVVPGPDDSVTHLITHQIWRATQGHVSLISDLGQDRMWKAPYSVRERRKGSAPSIGHGTPGSALPAAIGVQMGCPDEPVWVIERSESFQMNIQELATIVQERLPIRIAVLNSGSPGTTRQRQPLSLGGRGGGAGRPGPDLAKVASAYGILGLTVRKRNDIVPAIAKAMTSEGPALVDIRIAPSPSTRRTTISSTS